MLSGFNRTPFNRPAVARYYIELQDAATGADLLSATISLLVKETGVGSEDASLNIILTLQETGSGLDYVIAEVAPDAVITLQDNGLGVDTLLPIMATLGLQDFGSGAELDQTQNTLNITDSGIGADNIAIRVNITALDAGVGEDSPVLEANITLQDTTTGSDIMNVARTYFLIDDGNILQPLGLTVLLDSRQDLLPALKEYVEEIPGRDGEIYLGGNYQSRLLELHVVGERDRGIAKFLNHKGAQPLIFSRDINKTYHVKYAGQIPLTQYPTWMEFTIPFKMVDPFITGSFENIHTGSGTIVNSGTVETPLIIEITNATNPTIIIGNTELSYSGEISGTLIVDTKNLTVELNGENVLHNWSGGFPKLQPGETEVTADNSVTFKWRDKWC